LSWKDPFARQAAGLASRGVVAEADKVEGYEYRIVYSVEEEVLTMVIIRIGHRRESYGRL